MNKKKRSKLGRLFFGDEDRSIGFKYDRKDKKDYNGDHDKEDNHLSRRYNSGNSYYGSSFSNWDNWGYFSWGKAGESNFTRNGEDKFRVLDDKITSTQMSRLLNAIVKFNPSISGHNGDKNKALSPLREGNSDALQKIAKNPYNAFGSMGFILDDLFNLFFAENKFKKITPANGWWKEMMDCFDDYLLKDLTKDNYFFSGIILNNLLKKLRSMPPEMHQMMQSACQSGGDQKDKQDKEKEKNESPGEQNGEQQSPGNEKGESKSKTELSDKQKEGMNDISQQLKEAVKEGINEASKAASKLRKMGLDPNDMKDHEMIQSIEDLKKMINSVSLNKRDIMHFVHKSIKGMKRSVTGPTSVFEEDLFDSDCPEELNDFVNLVHPALFDQLNVIDKDPTAKFDIYVDCSGSMSSPCSIKTTRMQAAKIIAIRMRNMGILNNVYPYESEVSAPYSSKKLGKIMGMRPSGGTQGDNCVINIRKTGIPSMIITDGDDHYKEYSPSAYILCIESPIKVAGNAKAFSKNKQLVLFKNQKFEYI